MKVGARWAGSAAVLQREGIGPPIPFLHHLRIRVAGFFVDAALFARIAAGCNPASEMENTLMKINNLFR